MRGLCRSLGTYTFTMLDDLLRKHRDLLESMRGPFDQIDRLRTSHDELAQTRNALDAIAGIREPYDAIARMRTTYEEMLRPLREIQAVQADAGVAGVLARQREEATWLSQQMRPVLSDLNESRSILAAVRGNVLSDWLASSRQILETMIIPWDLSQSLRSIGLEPYGGLSMPRSLEQMVERLAPVVGYLPERPDGAILEEVRQRLTAIEESPEERVNHAVALMLQWLVANARRIGWRQISFLLFNVISPLLLTIYQKDVTEFLRPSTRAERRLVEQNVRTAARAIVPRAAQPRFRYVKVAALSVRAAPRQNSSRLTSLHLGDLLMEVKSTKDWTLVDYYDGDVHVRGWVMTRYVGKLRASDGAH
jgi:hypothetical protein